MKGELTLNKSLGLFNSKRFVIGFIVLLIGFSLSACNRHENDVEHDLVYTLDAIKNGTVDDQSYIYSCTLNVTDNNVSDKSGKITKKVANLVEYKILNVSEEENNIAKAKIRITAPDTYKMIEEIASTMQEENVDVLLTALNDKLNGKFPQKEFDVSVDLKLVNEHWYLIPNDQLADAFTGGVNEQYFKMGQDVIDKLLEEDD